jgi:putative phosphonate metabolism protein
MDAPRYAIYFVPPANSELYRFGARVLGYDCYTGEDLGCPPDSGLDPSAWAELTREPRIYGFHATLKAPFHLLPPFAETDLTTELRRFASIPRTLPAIAPTIQPLARFIAIVPREPSLAVDRLAADCVMAFDRFRRPLTADERHRRLSGGLSGRQVENLDRWGYPYVFDDFRFHMTLTGPLDADRRAPMLTSLQARFEKLKGDRLLPITQLVLLRQETSSTPFRAVDRIELTAGCADR